MGCNFLNCKLGTGPQALSVYQYHSSHCKKKKKSSVKKTLCNTAWALSTSTQVIENNLSSRRRSFLVILLHLPLSLVVLPLLKNATHTHAHTHPPRFNWGHGKEKDFKLEIHRMTYTVFYLARLWSSPPVTSQWIWRRTQKAHKLNWQFTYKAWAITDFCRLRAAHLKLILTATPL